MNTPMPFARRRPPALIVLAVAWLAGVAIPVQAESNRDWPAPVNDDARYGKLMLDRLEYVWGDGEDVVLWDAQAWYGGDYDRLWMETEGEDVASGGEGGELEKLDLLYSHRFSAFWDYQVGLGYQRIYGPGRDRDRSFLVTGLQGLAPYWFEIDATLRVSDEGDVSTDLEAEYDWLLTQRLVLQPRFETSFAFGQVEDFGVGEGLNALQLGLRLRYHIRRELAPYVGLSWTRKYGNTADLARNEGEDIENSAVVAGVRMWF